MSFVTRISQVLPAFTRVHRRHLTIALRARDVLPHLDNSSRLTDDAVTSTRAAVEVATPPVPGNAFLEEVTSEYGDDLVKELVKPMSKEAFHPSRVIANFVKKDDFDAAEVARREFEKMDYPIEPDGVYVKMALNSLRITEVRARSEAFLTWLSLVPISARRESALEFGEHLLRHPFDLRLLQSFCVSCAQEGIIEELRKSRILHHLFRYGHPTATRLLLEELERTARSLDKSTEEVMVFRNLAIRMHYIAGRKGDAEQLRQKAEFIEPSTQFFIEQNPLLNSTRFHSGVWMPPATHSRALRTTSDVPTAVEMASKLRFIRKVIMMKVPPHCESHIADFIFEYVVLLKRKRAIHALRRKVLQFGSLSAQSKWVAAEQMFYSSQHYPLAILRVHLHCFVADQILTSETQKILHYWFEQKDTYRRRSMDSWLSHNLPPIPTYQKLWPTNLSLALTWKAIVQLSDVKDLERLYQVLVDHAKLCREQDKLDQDPENPEDSGDESPPFVTPPTNFPSSTFFHHFVVAMATRISPLRGSRVIADMQQFGLKPTIDDWGTVAGAYARSGDIKRLQGIMNHVDKLEAAAHAPSSTLSDNDKKATRRRVMVMHNSAIRGLTECGMFHEARQVQKRMQNRGYFDNGMDKRTKAILHRLSRYEKGYFDEELKKRRRLKLVGRAIRADRSRVQWKLELDKGGEPTWEGKFDKEFVASPGSTRRRK